MSFLSNFFKSSENSSDVAKNRLKVAITSDRAVCSPELMEQMKNDIIEVISKYLDIDTDGLGLLPPRRIKLSHFSYHLYSHVHSLWFSS